MARTKIKRKRDWSSQRNNMHRQNQFLNTRGVGSKDGFIHDDSFDTEDSNYENHEHGLSKKSYKVGSNDLSQWGHKLNKGNKKKRRIKLRRGRSYSSDVIQRLMEEF